MTLSLFLPSSPAKKETGQTLDYDKIISTILMNENFLAKVSQFANTKIEDEEARIKTKNENSESDVRMALDSYNEQINKLKTELGEEIKSISEQIFKLRME